MADAIVIANQTLFGQYAANVLAFANIPTVTVDQQLFADNFRVAWNTHLAPSQVNQWTLDSLTLQILGASTIDFSVDIGFTLGPLTGGNTNDPVAAQTACLVSTQFFGAAPNRGRIYYMGLPEAGMTEGLWTNASLAACRDLTQAFVDGISAGTGNAFLRILRRPVAPFTAYVSNPVDNVVPRQSPAVIRSRRQAV